MSYDHEPSRTPQYPLGSMGRMVDFYGKLVGKYTINNPMDSMGLWHEAVA